MSKTPKLIINIVVITIVFLFILWLGILLAFPKSIDVNLYKNKICSEFQKSTGLDLNIENISLKTSLSPYVNVYAYHILIRYPDGSELLKIKDINLKIRALPLLQKKIQIEKIIANRPILCLSIDPNGKSSLDEYLAKKHTGSDIGGFKYAEGIPDTEILRYKVKIKDKRYYEKFTAEGEKLTLVDLPFSGAFKLDTKGDLSYGEEKHITYNLETESFIQEHFERLFNTNPFGYIKEYKVKADVYAKLKIKEEKKKQKITGNAEIDKLSYKLHNKILNDNYIKLSFDDNKISVNADTATEGSDRILIAGTAITGKNPDINLAIKAKNADLKNLRDTALTVMNAFNIKNELNLYNIAGKADLDFKIKSNLKQLKSEGRASITNASVRGRGIPYNIDRINASINFSGNSINIEPSELVINNTPVRLSGTVDSSARANIAISGKNLDAEKLSGLFLPSKITQEYKLKGLLNFSAKITGVLKEPKISILTDMFDFTLSQKSKLLTSFKRGEFKFQGTPERPDGELTLKDAKILPTEFANELRAETLKLKFNAKEFLIPTSKLYFKDNPLTLSGNVINYKTEVPEYIFNINGKVRSQSLYDFMKKHEELNSLKAAAKGYITVNGEIKGKGKYTDIKGSINADRDNYVSLLVIKELLNQPSRLNIDAVYDGETLTIHNVTLNKNTSDTIIALSGRIKPGSNPYAEHLKIKIPRAMTFSYAEFRNSEITVVSDLEINKHFNAPEIKGFLEIKNLNIPEYGLKSKVNDITFERDNINIKIPNLEIGPSRFSITADMYPSLSKKITLKSLNFSSEYLDIDKLNESFESAATSPVYPGIEVPLNSPEGRATIKVLKTNGMKAENITSDISISDNTLKMTNINGTAYRGTLRGRAEYNFLHTSTFSEFTGENADIRSLMQDLSKNNDDYSGRIDYRCKLGSTGTTKIQQQRTAKGYIEFTARNGKMGPLGEFEHLLYAQNLISQSLLKATVNSVVKALKPENTGMYTILKGKIEIAGGNAYIKPLRAEGPSMSLYMTGKINILNDVADVKIYGRISQEVERLLGELGNPVPKTIMTSPSETSLGNLFYDEYNTTVSKETIDLIPPLNPQIGGISSKIFEVTVVGMPESVRSVKTFKWIINTRGTQTSSVLQKEEKPVREEEPKPTVQPAVERGEIPSVPAERGKTIPDFMNSLPDNFN